MAFRSIAAAVSGLADDAAAVLQTQIDQAKATATAAQQAASTAQAAGDNARQMVLNRDPTLSTLSADQQATASTVASVQQNVTNLATLAASVQALSDASTADRSQLNTRAAALETWRTTASTQLTALAAQIAALPPATVVAVGSQTVPALLLGANATVVVTLNRAMANTNYTATPLGFGALLGGATLLVTTKTTTTVSVKVTAGLALTAGNTVQVLATSN